MDYKKEILTLELAKAEVEWECPLDVYIALDKAIASMAAWDRVIQRIKIYENDCILGLCDEGANDNCKKCTLNVLWSVRKIISEELKLAQSEVEDANNS